MKSLTEVMEEHPELCYFGMGAFDPRRKTREERQAYIEADRRTLLEHADATHALAQWLEANVSAIKTPSINSYSMKHTAERAIGTPVSNGQLIAAALMVGYPHRFGRPNVMFGMSQKDIKRLDPRRAT